MRGGCRPLEDPASRAWRTVKRHAHDGILLEFNREGPAFSEQASGEQIPEIGLMTDQRNHPAAVSVEQVHHCRRGFPRREFGRFDGLRPTGNFGENFRSLHGANQRTRQ
jgi:hypothetical protein